LTTSEISRDGRRPCRDGVWMYPCRDGVWMYRSTPNEPDGS
jgi:hypothetical protein